jgi:hypothetical protein
MWRAAQPPGTYISFDEMMEELKKFEAELER